MIISSELTGKTYETVEDCLAAEKAFKEEEKRKAEAEAKKNEELDKALDEVIAACEKYLELAGINYKISDGESESLTGTLDLDFINPFLMKELLGI